MNFQSIFHVLLGAILATNVQASPHLSLNPRDLFVPSTTCDDFVLGAAQTNIGQVCVGISGGVVTVTYPTLTAPNAYTDIHVYIDKTAPTNRAPGSFPYSLGNGACTITAGGTKATCTIPVKSEWRECNLKLYIATHASLSYNGQGQTGWGAGDCFGGSTGGNCAKVWTFYTQCQCPVVVSYEPITSTTTCLTTITNTITSIVTPPPTSSIVTCDDPNAGEATSTITTTTTTSIDLTCPAS